MRCEKVLSHLALFGDGMIERELSEEIAQHLRGCSACSRELDHYTRLRYTLHHLASVSAPEYLGNLVDMKINRARQESWKRSLRSAWEYRWSRIKTTEGMWYLTRLMGALATLVLFISIYSAINPIYLSLADQIPTRVAWPKIPAPQQLAYNVQKAFGMLEAQKRPMRSSEAKINDLYLLNLSQSASRTARRRLMASSNTPRTMPCSAIARR
jgi:predicted anti-sigma-YlaC factor YlaD